MIIDVSQHLGFLNQISYITRQEYENKIQVSAGDRTFYGTYSLVEQPFDPQGQYRAMAFVNPLLPVKERASSLSEYYVGIHPVPGSADYILSVIFLEDETSSEKKYVMHLARDIGIYFDYGNFTKIF